MKTITRYLVLFLFVGVAYSCFKLSSEPPPDNTTTSKKLEETVVPDNFNWSTSKAVEVNITGLPTIVTIKSTLTISLPDGTKLFSLFHDMSQNLKVNLTVASNINKLTLKYGTGVYLLSIVNNKAEFSFIPVVTDED